MLLVFTLAACGGPSGPVPTATRVPNAPTNTVSAANCPRAGLEDWLARSNSLVSEFTSVVNSSLTTPREKIASVLDQLGSLQGEIVGVSAPDCATEHRQMIEDMMDRAVGTFTDYGNGQTVDMPGFILDFNDRSNKIKAKEAELNALYETLP